MKADEARELVNLINAMIEENSEVIEEAEVVEEPVEKVYPDEAKTKKMFRGQIPEGFDWAEASVVRSPMTGDRVFLKYGDEKRWIPDLETLTAIGWDLGGVEGIEDEQMKGLKEAYGVLAARLW